MDPDKSYIQPDWYRVERDAENIINRLYSVKELMGYLSNPDEYVRRIAIIRLGTLRLKDSTSILEEIIEDSLEHPKNRELAAWALKSVCKKWNIELFLPTGVSEEFTGNENYRDLFGISFNNIIPVPGIGTGVNGIFHENDAVAFGRLDSMPTPDTAFPVSEWLKRLYGAVKPVPVLKRLLKGLGLLLSTVRTKLFRRSYHFNSGRRLQRSWNLKTALRKVFTVIAYPARYAFRHGKLLAAIMLALYLLMSLTFFGRSLFYKYTGVDLKDINSAVLASVKSVSAYALNEIQYIAGAENPVNSKNTSQTTVQSSTGIDSLKKYRVTAKSGLNLRKEPDGQSEKLTQSTIPFNTELVYLDKTRKDSSGKIWMYVRTPNGTEGWVISKWLKETGGDI